MMNELWSQLGEQTDLDPATAGGAAVLLRWLNQGQRSVANWEFTDGHILRFACLFDETYVRSVVKTGTLLSGSIVVGYNPAYAQFDPTDPNIGANDDQYNGWLIEIASGTGAGQIKLITDYIGASRIAYVASDWSTAPDSTSVYKIYKRHIMILPAGHPWAGEHSTLDPKINLVDVLKVTDMTNEQALATAVRGEDYLTTVTQAGDPSNWYFFGNRIIFDMAPNAVRWYKLEYYRQPVEMALPTDTPELPDSWQQGILLWARWWGFARSQETSMSYSAKNDLGDFMKSIRRSMEMRYERDDTTIVVER
jgi:hypothetical protein